MALPDSIRIGGIDFTVKEVADLKDGNQGLNGWIRYNESEIHVEEKLGPQMKRATVWHEVFHGVLEQAAVKHNEQLIEVLAYGIVQVLRDNPWLREVNNEAD